MIKKSSKVNNKGNCCGCAACYSVCTRGAIEMIEDDEGFEYPMIHEEKCIKCKMCIKVCPYVDIIKTVFINN